MSRRLLRLWPLAALIVLALGAWLWLAWLESGFNAPYSRIEDGLYLGRAVERPPPGTSAVVNLCGRADAYDAEASLHAPVFEGGKEPDIEWLRDVVAFIEAQRRAGRTTYVHCLAGMNRSAAAMTAYLMKSRGWGRDEALAFVKTRRPQAHPNPTLMRLLSEWERKLAGR